MSDPDAYRWRQLSKDERERLLAQRRQRGHPAHSPHHIDSGRRHYHITAACYEHVPHIGHSLERMSAFADALLEVLHANSSQIPAWALLPNHYHALVLTKDVLALLRALGQLHGRSSHQWNTQEQTRGRQVWCKAMETVMQNDEHYYSTVNYIHHNPVKHGYCSKWTDWPWSSAHEYMERMGRAEALRLWQAYPVEAIGQGWDDAEK